MEKLVDDRRDVETSAIYKDQGVTFKFEWTIENFNYEVQKGCYSPKIELPGATLSIFMKYTDSYVHTNIKSSSPLKITGKITANESEYSINKSLISEKYDYVLSIKHVDLASVRTYKFLFYMTVYSPVTR